MKRVLSRHTVVALLVLMTSSLGGMSLAVVAFGQSGGDADATVPTGDYTGTTPSTAPLSNYQSTQPLSSYQSTQTTQTVTPTTSKPTQTGQALPSTTKGTTPSRTHGSTTVPSGGGGDVPSRSTGSAPTKLAFTGGEPILIGAFGILLMITGVALHRRRRAARSFEV
jgi:hypothetical protein